MKVLIFGVSGNSGRYVARYYLGRGAEVWRVGRRKNIEGISGINYVSLDIYKDGKIKGLPTDFDLVVNFAGVQPSIMETSENTDLYRTLRDYVNVNLVGTYNVLEYVASSNIGTYVYATTHRDYENYWSNGQPLKNDMPPAVNYRGDHSMYAITKVAGQMMGEYMVPLGGTRCFNVRLPMIFMVPESPFYLANGEPRLMPFLKIIRDAIGGGPLEIWGDATMPRDYVYIDNLVNMIDKCYLSSHSGGTFSVGTGEAVTTEEFVKTIGEVFGGPNIEYIYYPERHTFKCAVYDVNEQMRVLGYEPVLLREMLERMKQKIFTENYLEKWGWNK